MRTAASEPELKPLPRCGTILWPHLIWAFLFLAATVGVMRVLRLELPTAIRYALPAGPVLLGVVYFRILFRDLPRMTDELQRKLHFEAAVGTCAGVYIAMIVYPLFQRAGLIGTLDPLVVLILMSVLYTAGYSVAKRRYQ